MCLLIIMPVFISVSLYFFRYFCRAVEYDEQLRRCIIFEEDSFSQKDDLRTSTSPTHDLFDLICLDGGNGALKNEQ